MTWGDFLAYMACMLIMLAIAGDADRIATWWYSDDPVEICTIDHYTKIKECVI